MATKTPLEKAQNVQAQKVQAQRIQVQKLQVEEAYLAVMPVRAPALNLMA